MVETCRELPRVVVPETLSARQALEQENGDAALRIEDRTGQAKERGTPRAAARRALNGQCFVVRHAGNAPLNDTL
jgi:hypothetical protein